MHSRNLISDVKEESLVERLTQDAILNHNPLTDQ